MLGQLHRLSGWFFLLFLVAQVGTMTPLLSIDILHELGRPDAGISAAVGVAQQHGAPTRHPFERPRAEPARSPPDKIYRPPAT